MNIADAIARFKGKVGTYYTAECDTCFWEGNFTSDIADAELELIEHMTNTHGAEDA